MTNIAINLIGFFGLAFEEAASFRKFKLLIGIAQA
jgi:hypothetical protein